MEVITHEMYLLISPLDSSFGEWGWYTTGGEYSYLKSMVIIRNIHIVIMMPINQLNFRSSLLFTWSIPEWILMSSPSILVSRLSICSRMPSTLAVRSSMVSGIKEKCSPYSCNSLYHKLLFVKENLEKTKWICLILEGVSSL